MLAEEPCLRSLLSHRRPFGASALATADPTTAKASDSTPMPALAQSTTQAPDAETAPPPSVAVTSNFVADWVRAIGRDRVDSGSLTEAGGEAGACIDLMRQNTQVIVEALQ